VTDGIGDAAMWACISFQGRADDPVGTEYNFDVLGKHDVRLYETVMPVVGCDGKMMMAAFSITALRHFLRTYPESASVDMRRIDRVGATILLHHMAYLGDLEYIRAILEDGFDLTHAGFVGGGGLFVRVMTFVMRCVFRTMTFPPNDVVHFAMLWMADDAPPYLHVAAAYAQVGALELLLAQRKLDVNAPNAMGFTPLHLAAYMGHPEIVEMLLAAGAHPLLKDERWRTPASWAERRGHLALASRLREVEVSAPRAPKRASALASAAVVRATVGLLLVGAGVGLALKLARRK
jgi:hypothetical protein